MAEETASRSVKIDLHVHSKYSKRPSQWVLQKLGCPESFTEPLQIYRTAKRRGMSLVTITDHNTLDGALEIAHLPDTFVSEEITAYFPQDGCKIHVLAYQITEAQHRDIQLYRQNILELVDYLQQEDIPHVAAHALYSVNDRLKQAHIEQLMLLFKYFELNGARDDGQNQCLRRILNALNQDEIERLANKHDLAPKMAIPWEKYLTGGSDDHSGLNIARTCTELFMPADYSADKAVEPAIQALKQGRTRVHSQPSSPQTMAHNLYGIAYQFYRNKFNLERHVNKDILLKFLDRSLRSEAETDDGGLFSRLYYFWNHRKRPRAGLGVPENLVELLREETRNFLQSNPQLLDLIEDKTNLQAQEARWYAFVNEISNRVMNAFANHLMDHLSGANVFNIFHTLGAAGGLYTLLAPYFVSFNQFTKDRESNTEALAYFDRAFEPENQEIRVAHFTDTFYEVNGVAHTLQQQVRIARKNQKKLTIITCDANRRDENGIRNFRPVGVYRVPEYEQQRIYYPPFLEMLNYCYEQGFTHIQAATPGPIGLAALAISNILKLPITGTYHTAFPQYAQYLTGDDAIEGLTWKYILWFYNHMDRIYVSSRSSADELIDRGIPAAKIKRFPRGINTDRFHPSKRNGILKKKYAIGDELKLLYVGRVSKEKNLHLLAEAFKNLSQQEPALHLIVVGDGPYLAEMKQCMAHTPCIFTGYKDGEELAALYASSDIFVFPSTTDTFGNVVLEAQASGLPVVVTDQGGPQENLLPDQTGLVVEGDSVTALTRAMRLLVADTDLRRQMGRAARKYMEDRSFENAFIQTWQMFKEIRYQAGEWMAKAG